jgi:hypothetical protein
VFPLILLLAGGCASTSAPKPAILSLRSSSNGRGFAQTFPEAYFSQSDDGDREILLINDGVAQTPTHEAGPLQPVASLPLAQYMHFKILWNPLPGTHTDAPSTTNAVIDWTIRASPPGRAGDSLHYRGAGFVELDGNSHSLFLIIRNASLELTSHTGSLVDPLGTCTINGHFLAIRNDGLVNGTLADLDQKESGPDPVDAAASIGPDASSPPPRTPAP